MSVGARLEEIYDAVRSDPFWEHLRKPMIRLVPGEGSYTPRVLVVGEAPGATENTHGRPFCGASGRVLRSLLEAAGVWDGLSSLVGSPFTAYITNVVKYWPGPGNRTPDAEEIEHGRPTLREEWKALGGPKVIVAAGKVAATALLPAAARGGRGAGTRATVGKPYPMGNGVTLWPMHHPAYPLRQPSVRPRVEEHWEEFGEWLRNEG